MQLDGDAEIQQAVRFSLFHVLQAGARAEGRAIAAKGLTGPGLRRALLLGHRSLRAAHAHLPRARHRRARAALAPLHPADGHAAGPASSGCAARRSRGAPSTAKHARATGRQARPHSTSTPTSPTPSSATSTPPATTPSTAGVGLELLVETARLWRSLGHHDAAGRFRIDGVTGPDEYSAVADNNVYTNLMAQQNLRAAAEHAARHPDRARDLGVDDEEMARWRDAAEAMCIPYDGPLGVHPQSEGFTAHQVWDFAATTPEQYPLLLHFPYFDLYRKQVVKQADLVLAMHQRPDAFTPAAEGRATSPTTNGSPCGTRRCRPVPRRCSPPRPDTCSWPTTTLPRRRSWTSTTWNTTPATACTWPPWPDAGSRWSPAWPACAHHDSTVSFAPRLPAELTRLAFTITSAGPAPTVEVTAAAATYTLLDGAPLDITHHGQPLTVRPGGPVPRPIPRHPPGPSLRSPRDAEPARRRPPAGQQRHRPGSTLLTGWSSPVSLASLRRVIPLQIRCDKATRAHPDHTCTPTVRGHGPGRQLPALASRPPPNQARQSRSWTPRPGSAAEALTGGPGWTAAGVIPDYAAGPTGVLYPTTPFCKAVT